MTDMLEKKGMIEVLLYEATKSTLRLHGVPRVKGKIDHLSQLTQVQTMARGCSELKAFKKTVQYEVLEIQIGCFGLIGSYQISN